MTINTSTNTHYPLNVSTNFYVQLVSPTGRLVFSSITSACSFAKLHAREYCGKVVLVLDSEFKPIYEAQFSNGHEWLVSHGEDHYDF